MRILLLALYAAAALFHVACAAVVHVAMNGVDVPSCGGTSTTPCGSLRYALTDIFQPFDTIQLAAGVYEDDGPTIVFSAESRIHDVTIQAAASTSPSPVTIDRAYNGRLLTFMAGAGSVRITGIHFYRGGWQVPDASKDYSGALLQFRAEDPDIEFKDCVFEANLNPNKGFAGRGGVGTISEGSPRFTNCVFTANWGGIAGTFHVSGTSAPVFDGCIFEHPGCHPGGWGGVVVPEDQSRGIWRNSVFRNNTCDYGGAVDDGGIASPLFESCRFEHNFGKTLGGAYYGFGNTHTKFKGCLFFGNRINKGGVGQDYYLSSSASTMFEDCIFDSGPNPVFVSDGASGSAMDNTTVTMIGCTVRGYRAALGVIIFSIDGHGTLESTLFIDNECVKGGVIYATNGPLMIRNCMFVNNVATEGGAIAHIAVSTVQSRIIGSHFEGNVGKNVGGAIRLAGTAKMEITGCTFVVNSAQGIGGGAIWSEGQLTASESVFRGNYLLSSDDDASDSCGSAAGTGGAIYSSLPNTILSVLDESSTTTTSSTNVSLCSSAYLQLNSLVFDGNNASLGGSGGIFLDQYMPTCMTSKEIACNKCTFTENDAAYGADVATIVNDLELQYSRTVPNKWTLMVGNEIVVGARDLLSQALQGSHSPVLVRLKLLSRSQNGGGSNVSSESPPTTVYLTANASRTIRNGAASFKNVMLHMTSGRANNVDLPLTLSFTSDSPRSGSSATINASMAITLAKCPQNGLVNAVDGSCLIEASGGSEKVIAGVTFSVVVGGLFLFVLYWSHKNSNGVMKTIRQLVTGSGASPSSARQSVRVRRDAEPPDVRARGWKRTKSSKVFALRERVQLTLSKGSDREKTTADLEESTTPSNGPEDQDAVATEVWSLFVFHRELVDTAPAHTREHSERQGPNEREIETHEQELEYYRTRTVLMKGVLARLVTEDLLLLVLNLYIYLSNHSNDVFLRSKFRTSLELSIFTSAIHFGAQGQAIVAWLQMNKVGEIKRNLQTMRNLQSRMASLTKAPKLLSPSPVVEKTQASGGKAWTMASAKVGVEPFSSVQTERVDEETL
ncbi:hypothetical protein FI667_g9277, partial [Globisporangium splendens]